MEVNKRDVRGLLHTADQFIVPMFQRYYVWSPKNWERLWDDLLHVIELAPDKKHFMGSLVCLQIPGQPGSVPQYLVIDGQQRLTTIAVLLCALRDTAKQLGTEKALSTADQIQNRYLMDEYRKKLERFKILPRTKDRQAMFDLFEKKPIQKGNKIHLAYHYFKDEIANYHGGVTEDSLTLIFETLTTRLSFVTITLFGENPFEIFETLNAEGVRLEEADLIRNFIFMRVPLSDQDEFEDGYWKPFEVLFEADGDESSISVTEFYRDFLMKGGAYIRKNEVYEAFKNEVEQSKESVETLLGKLNHFGKLYLYIKRPSTSPSEIRREMIRLSRLGISTANPLLIHLLEEHSNKRISSKQVNECLRAIQSFIIRRSITGARTRGYGDQFPASIPKLKGDPVASLVEHLAAIGWPVNSDVLNLLPTFSIYTRESATAQLLLLGIEESYGHKEPVNVLSLLDRKKIQLEHVMPQTVSDDAKGDAWKTMLGPDWQQVHEKWLHTIGNLTLSGYNPELSNEPFDYKREELKASNLQLNKYFVACDRWDADEISKRALFLSEVIFTLWPEAGGFESKEIKS